MISLEYKEENFPEVLRYMRVCRHMQNTETPHHIHFNPINQMFEYFNNDELNQVPDDVMCEDPGTAMTKLLDSKQSIANAVAEADSFSNSDYLDEAAIDDEFDKIEMLLDEEELTPVFDNDDPEVLKAVTENMKVIHGIQQKLQAEKREELAKVIADLYKCDIISESDVALALVENNEYKKLLSMLFGLLGVQVSSTQISRELAVSTGNLVFNPRIEYGLEDYRRGASQCLVDVRRLAESKDQIKNLEDKNQELTSTLAVTRKEAKEFETQYNSSLNTKAEQKEQKLVVPIMFVISWKNKNAVNFLRVKTGKKAASDGSYPTKYLEKTSRVQKAKTFSNEEAVLQISRLIKYSQNLTFVDLKDKGTKELSSFFSLNKVTVESL